jgi:hypothetical protein
MERTRQQYNTVIEMCKEVFLNKMKDYGSAWRILRTPSLTDQVYIKANRIRSIQQKGTSRIAEGIKPEFIGIVNYSLMALIQLELGSTEEIDMLPDKATEYYDRYFFTARDLMLDKNHDYDEAWRNMRISSLTDIILMKLMRIKQIEDNQGEPSFSEGVDANYQDIINYAVFALIKIEEGESN